MNVLVSAADTKPAHDETSTISRRFLDRVLRKSLETWWRRGRGRNEMLVAVRLRASTFASATVDRSRFGGQPSVSGAVYTAGAGALGPAEVAAGDEGWR